MMDGVRRLVLLSAVSLCACSMGDLQLFVPSPSPVNAATVIVHLKDMGGQSTFVEPKIEGPIKLPIERWTGGPPDQATLTLAYYSQAPDELGVRTGVLRPALPGEARACALAEPVAVHQTSLTRAQAAPWQEDLMGLPASMSEAIGGDGALRCTLPNLCLQFEPRVVPLPGAGVIDYVVAIDDQSALVGDLGESFWRVWVDGSFEKLERLGGLPSRSGFQDPDGTFWFSGSRGRVAHGPLEGPFTIEELPSVLEVEVSSLRRDPVTGVILAVGIRLHGEALEQVVIFRRDPTGWTELSFIEVRNASRAHTRVRWVGNGEALIVHGGPLLLYYDGTLIRPRDVGSDDPYYGLDITDVALHPEHGVVFSDETGRLYRGQSPFLSWFPLLTATIEVDAGSVIPYAHGYVFGGEDGVVSQYYPGGAPCPVERLFDSDADQLVQVGDAIVGSGSLRDSSFDNSVTWLILVR